MSSSELIKKILEEGYFTPESLALVLFPTKKHPLMALKYVMSGEKELKESVVKRLELVKNHTVVGVVSAEVHVENTDTQANIRIDLTNGLSLAINDDSIDWFIDGKFKNTRLHMGVGEAITEVIKTALNIKNLKDEKVSN